MGLCALELFLGLDFGHEHWRIVMAYFYARSCIHTQTDVFVRSTRELPIV
jgi:hypothetical protein